MILASEQTLAEGYTHYPLPLNVYARRARLFQNFPEPILVVGCGFGFLVAELIKLRKGAWGIDASEYYQTHKATHCWGLWNILDGPLSGYGTVVTEDLLPWLTDDEAIVAAKNCAASGRIVIHLVTESGQADYNYHSTGYWMNLTQQLTVSLEGM